ncbi:MAG: DUF1667 domain-containing protein [Saccharofermentanales bacterium]|jgi:CxxC motif-containing protein
MIEMICTVCPQGCHLTVDPEHDYDVTGNRCLRGAAYGKSEASNPTRTVTSTVRVTGGRHRRCPVKTDRPIPKADVMAVMAALDEVTVAAPVHRGDVILEHVLGHPAHVIATRDID